MERENILPTKARQQCASGALHIKEAARKRAALYRL